MIRIHARIQRLKSFSELRALAHVLDSSKAVISDRAGVSTSVPPKLKWLDKRKAEIAEKSQVPNPKQRQSSGAGCKICGSHDHWQAACPKRKSESGNAKTTGGTTGSRPAKRGKQRSSTEAVSNVPVQEPQVTRTDPKKWNFGALRTGDSGKGPKKTGQKSSGPEKTGKNGIPPEKITSIALDCTCLPEKTFCDL
ncbi:Activity-regulated cytoskeleton-associated protein [Aphis craccivora]|uniref:Activity-regulated cytoskeleton-associated protein n=1 Tax=Aphis craccivora TaxID=307492 RepID=A0A6G0XLL3_APHCR|nr:Activity-regulated cytoskeleton-associated protein [Aphis craccivora]